MTKEKFCMATTIKENYSDILLNLKIQLKEGAVMEFSLNFWNEAWEAKTKAR